MEATERRPAGAPSALLTLAELPRLFGEACSLPWGAGLLASARAGDGHPVMVLPGFLAGDESTIVLRGYLRRLGYEVMPWALGRNLGSVALQEALVRRFLQVSRRTGQPISLVGQSLGGVFSRELARRYPDRVRQVVTLGSPFGIRDGSSTVSVVRGAFRRLSGASVERMRARLPSLQAPPVRCTAVYSKTDGVVSWRSCIERSAHNTENIEVYGSHCGMSVHPAVLYAVADRLQQPLDDWAPFRDAQGCSSLLYPKPVYAD